MIQRPQSIFLLIVIIAETIVCTGLPIWAKTGLAGQHVELFLSQWTQSLNGKAVSSHANYGLFIVVVASALLSIGILLSFKNRIRQMTLGLINSMLIAVAMGYIFYIIFNETIPLFEPTSNGQYEIGFYALVGALLANMIANRLIRKDEMLVQSSNRMR
jgi:glucan phosphoethanolaminetransferase (alkaline phosphatase superfamily)